MFASRKRQKLVKQGYSCGKTRRKSASADFWTSLEESANARLALCAAFIGILALLLITGAPQAEPAKRFFVGLLVFCTALAQLWINHPETFLKNSRLGLVFSVCLIHLGLIKLILILVNDEIISGQYALFIIPYAIGPLMLSVLLGKNHGIFGAVFLSIWGAILQQGGYIFLVTSLITGFIAVYVTLSVRRRSRLIRAGIYVGLANWLMGLAFGNIAITWESIADTQWQVVGIQSLLAVSTGFLTAVLVSGLLPVFEHCFRITTDISWLELADLNHPLLKRMTIEAPGTYHHSLVVANLAEAAAESVGANANMCRVAAYFHDIGKLVKPEYFTENMRTDRNPHDELSPTMSALIIIAHVKEGVDLALRYKLNQQIIDVIQQHHGTSLVWYFYKRAKQQEEDARTGGKIMNIRDEDIPEVKEESFRYSGPRPQFKESGIISMADMVESASRSLGKPTPQRIEQLVNDLIESRIADHQLDDCGLSLKEIRTIADSFTFTLKNMLHSRISYPDEDRKKPASRAPSQPKSNPGSTAPKRVSAA